MIKKKINVKRILLSIFMLLISLTSTYTFGYAQEQYPFDATNVLEDLESTGDFNILEYPFDLTGNIVSAKVFNFVEYGYTVTSEKKGDFALYVYFYNPGALKIDVTSYQNRIQLATSYNTKTVTYDSLPTDYTTFPLIYCNKSERTNYEGLFYKFRVGFTDSERKLFMSKLNPNGRRYDVSGVVLAEIGKDAKEYTVGGTWKFSGYSKGYGVNANSESTLKCDGATNLETVRLNVYETTYRSSSAPVPGHKNDITSVYFAVPKRLLDDYGRLQKIKAEWYEYKTNPIVVINNHEYYLKFYDALGKEFNTYDESLRYGLGFGLEVLGDPTGLYKTHAYSYGYNVKDNDGIYLDTVFEKNINSLNYLFYNEKLDDDVVVTASELKNWILSEYNHSYNNGKLPTLNGEISADLFQESIDENRIELLQNPEDKRGYVCLEIDADDKFDILDYDDTHTWWEQIFDYGFIPNVNINDGIDNVAPIEEISSDYALYQKAKETFAQKYLVSDVGAHGVSHFYDFVKETYEAKDEYGNQSLVPYIFHFAQTDYYSETGSVIDGYSTALKDCALMATETVFMDFKVIQLTFNSDGVQTVIPAVQDPIAFIGGGISGDPELSNDDPIMAWLCAIGFILGAVVSLGLELWLLSMLLGNDASVLEVILALLLFVAFAYVDYLFVDLMCGLIVGYGGLGLGWI